MKRLVSFSIAATMALAMVSCGGSQPQEENAEENATMEENANELSGTYTLLDEKSQLMWEGNMLKIGGVSLYGHNGTLAIRKGELVAEDGKLVKGTIVVDMTSITPTDENYGEDNPKEDLIGHLSSPDFFNTAEFPTATFEITGQEGNTVMGNMTIRGITHPEKIENVEMEMVDGILQAKGSLTLDRQKYDVAFKMPAEDKVLSDDLDLDFMIVAENNNTASM